MKQVMVFLVEKMCKNLDLRSFLKSWIIIENIDLFMCEDNVEVKVNDAHYEMRIYFIQKQMHEQVASH